MSNDQSQPLPNTNRGLKVLFLSSDTGGGHRASAESLAKQFELLYPGSTYELLDLATELYPPPYSHIVSNYKHLSKNPSQWKVLYRVTNSRMLERSIVDSSIKYVSLVSERAIREKIKSIKPDVVVSVHPLQTSVPSLSCAKISHETGRHLPMFTVVTDLGSGHLTWFASSVEKMFVGSTQIYDLAKDRGHVPDEKLVLLGLPIRHDFALQAAKMKDRMSLEGQQYQRKVREELKLPATDRKTLLIMGGGEGVGSLSNIVDALYYELTKQGIDALILVVCGRNEELRNSLKTRNWDQIYTHKDALLGHIKRSRFPTFRSIDRCRDGISSRGCIEAPMVTRNLRRVLSSGNFMIHNASTSLFVPTNEDEEEKDEPYDEAADGQLPELMVKSMSFGNLRLASYEQAAMEAIETKEDGDGEEVEAPEDEACGLDLSKEAIIPVHDDDMAKYLPSTFSTGKVDVVGLGFITNMADYMVAADILISKAGPGTISEAAALSLPVLLTSYLPGQEEGNVDYVIDGNFGAYCDDSDPTAIGEEIASWLMDPIKLLQMSKAAKKMGAPNAARDIVQQIGDSTLKWRELNDAMDNADDASHKVKNQKSKTAGMITV
ncbi:unnamed protein product [Cylindrotheca closterium]|uniref:monogalactosyldiacylglycerol synthase n=1 Tax=Cylindrotheca closterium TaxID=2856 RepID=A0AAD2JLQ7_9STRA|nr:unnamed protein product [Cylindrotheca closterium]